MNMKPKSLMLACLIAFISNTARAQSSISYIRNQAVPVQVPTLIDTSVLPALGDHQVITIGEIHGSEQGPGFAYGLTKLLVDQGQKPIVAIEFPVQDQDAINEYLLTGNEEVLKTRTFFAAEIKDGRTSIAMALLLNRLRSLGVQVFCFDPGTNLPGQERDEGMARNISAALFANPNSRLIVLTGNIHSSVSVGTPFDPSYRPMGFELGKIIGADKIRSLNIRYYDGGVWACIGQASDCRVHTWKGIPTNFSEATKFQHYFLIEQEIFEGHHGTLFVRTLTPSSPYVP
jgi:hypothetical protein